MKKRCYNSKILKYKRYGARGVKVCNDWLTFENFVDWALENGYQNDLQIDRIDGDKDYCPENCRWVTPLVQSNNRKCVNKIEFNGLVKSMTEWAEYTGIKRRTLSQRYHVLKWPVSRMLTEL